MPKPKVPRKLLPKTQGTRIPASFSALVNGADKVDLLSLGRDGFDIAYEEESHHCGESSEHVSFRNTLNRIKIDVKRCLNWLDSGLCPCVCGLLGPAPKPLMEAHVRQPLPAGPVRGASFKEKKKGKGLMRFKPKVIFKPVSNRRGLGQFVGSKLSGPARSIKGRKFYLLRIQGPTRF